MLITRNGQAPTIHPSAVIASSAQVIGNVSIGQSCYIDYNAVIESSGPPIEIADHVMVLVLPLSVVDNSVFFPIRLTVPSDAPYDQEALSCSHFKRRGLYDLSCLLVLARSLPSPFSGAALAAWLAPSSTFPLSSCIQAQPSPPSAQATHPA